MNFDDLIPSFGEGVFSLLFPLGLLCGAALVQRATKRFQRVSQQHGFGVSACGLTGHDAARRLLAGCGLSNVAVIATTGRDVYHTSKARSPAQHGDQSGPIADGAGDRRA